MKIQNTNTLKFTNFNCLIIGKSGVGKTTLAKTIFGKTIVVSLESGLLALKDCNIDYIEIAGINGIEKVENFRSIIKSLSVSDYENIFIDSLSELAQCFVEVASNEFPEDSKALKKWGLYNEMMTKMVKFIRDMNKNVFFTCLEKTEKDEANRRFIVPDLPGSISHKLPQYFDCVLAYITFEKDGEKVRKLLTDSTQTYTAKDRSGKLLQLEEPDLSKIIEKIYGNP